MAQQIASPLWAFIINSIADAILVRQASSSYRIVVALYYTKFGTFQESGGKKNNSSRIITGPLIFQNMKIRVDLMSVAWSIIYLHAWSKNSMNLIMNMIMFDTSK